MRNDEVSDQLARSRGVSSRIAPHSREASLMTVPWSDPGPGRLAINRLIDRRPLDGAAIDRFLERHGAPIVEGDRATFLWRGEADEVMVRHRVVGLPDPLPLRRLYETDLWYATTELPAGSRVEYQFELVRGEHREQYVNDPLNPKLAHGPFGPSSVLSATGYSVPDWCQPDPEARPGRAGRADADQPGAAPRRALPGLPARALPHRGALSPADRARRRRLSGLHRGQDRSRQPDPPW